MNVDEVGEFLEHQGFSDTQIDDIFLEHFGVRGMKWGVRRQRTDATARSDRKVGLGPNQLRKENKRIAEAGGGLKGTLRVRREMIDSGQLSKEQARTGSRKFKRNLIAAVAIGSIVGVASTKAGRDFIAERGLLP